MSIVSFNVQAPMLQGIAPRAVQLVSTDSLATITTAGYMNKQGQVLQGENLSPTDVINVIYSYSASSNSGIFGIFTASIASTGVITLVQWANPGDVLLPVVSGDIASFNGTTGQIKDSGLAPSSTSAQLFVATTPGSLTSGNFPLLNDVNGTLNAGRAPSAATAGYKVVMSPGSLTTGNFPALADANGTLAAGLPPSAASQAFLVASPGSLTSGHLVKLSDVNGTIADQGVAMKSVAQAAVAGGAAAQTVTDAFCTSAASVVASWNDTTNAVSIQKVAAGNGSFVVTSSGDPGASHINYVIFK